MAILYLDRKGLELKRDGAALALYESGDRVRTVPLALVSRVVIRAETVLTSQVLGMLAEAGVAVVILSGRRGRRVALVTGAPHNDARIRLAHYASAREPVFRLIWAKRVVALKLMHQTALLDRALAQRPDLRHPLSGTLATLRELHARVVGSGDKVAHVASLLGVEGAAQAAYFRGYTRLFAPSLAFTGRNRRPPRDPVNACLSLAYTLVHFEAVRAAYAAGLDPFIGFFHETSFGRESLACDLVEPLRPRVDAWVWELFRERVLRPEHFREDKGACVLDKTARMHFYQHYERFRQSANRVLRRYCRVLVRVLLQDAPVLPTVAFEEEGP